MGGVGAVIGGLNPIDDLSGSSMFDMGVQQNTKTASP